MHPHVRILVGGAELSQGGGSIPVWPDPSPLQHQRDSLEAARLLTLGAQARRTGEPLDVRDLESVVVVGGAFGAVEGPERNLLTGDPAHIYAA